MSKWISVNDRLPEYGEPVLLAINGEVQDVPYVLNGDETVPDWFDPVPTSCATVWWNEVTHWMPLPEVPEDE